MPRFRLRGLRFRWSLRTLLLSVVVCALVLRVWLIYVEPYRSQRHAADALVKMGAFVETRPSGPTWMREIVGEDKMVDVVRVELVLGSFTDSDLEHLGDLPHVYHLMIKAPGVTDDGLRHLSGMNELTDLVLVDTAVTDRGLAHLGSLAKLGLLIIQGEAQVTSAGMAHLERELPKLNIYRN